MKMKLLCLLLFAILMVGASCTSQKAENKPEFNIAWSIYAGWMPWPYADESGILKKWADKYNIKINLKQFDYVPSIEAYSSGQVDGVSITNMDSFGVIGSVDSTAIIIGDYSNGNDKVITRNQIASMEALKGQNVYLVEGSVSQYLLARGLTIGGTKLTETDLNLFNVSDSDIGPAFLANKNQNVLVTWNPICLEVLDQDKSTSVLFDSSKIPEEILDLMIVRTDKINKYPELGKALSGAWYETLGLLKNSDAKAIQSMAKKSGTTSESFNRQIITTYLYSTPLDANKFATSKRLIDVMDLVRKFSFEHGLFGQGYNNVDDIGISFPNGSVLGNPNNVKFRFIDTYMK